MIEIVLRKIEESGDVSEIILALLPTVGTIDTDHSTDVIAFPGLVIRMKEQTVYRDCQLVSMTHYEFFTLSYLAQHPGWVFSKEQIYEAVWRETGDRCGTAVVNVISQIRRKIGERYIKTVIGSGYKFEA